MRLFTLVDFHHLVLAIFLCCVAAVVIYLALRYPSKKDNDESGKEEPARVSNGAEYPVGYRKGPVPVPPLFVFLFIGFLVWFIVYVLVVGIFGGPV